MTVICFQGEFIKGEHFRKELHIWLSFLLGHSFKFVGVEDTAFNTIDKTR